MKGRLYILFYLGLSILFYSCSETKTLEPGQYLYDGAKINIHAIPPVSKSTSRDLKTELKSLLRPAPNGSFLGIRVKLLLYNLAGKSADKGIKKFIRNMGEPPVLASYSAFEKNRSVLQNRLENLGYFKDTVMLDTVYKGQKLSAIYTASIGSQYRIRNVIFPSDDDSLSKAIARMQTRSLLKSGNPYNLDVIKNERTRIDTRLKQQGYYYFSPENLLIRADSSIGANQVDMNLVVKKTTPSIARRVFRINEIVVFTNYNLNQDTIIQTENIPKFDGYTIVDPEKRFRPVIFSRALVFKTGDKYNRREHDLSLNRLVSLGVFKFIKIRFDERDTASNLLNAYYYLTPMQKKSIRFEVSGLTQSNDGNGGQLSINWRNRSIFRGAELLTATAYLGFLRQYEGGGIYTNTNKLGIDVSLYVPRIMGPIQFSTNSGFIPKTRFSIGYEFYQRSDQYTLNSAKASFAYIWKETVTREHTLEIFRINQVNPTYIDSNFQLELDTNVVLARSIEKTFIIGPTYNFNLNTLLKPNQRTNNYYFNANLDLSSNIIGLVSKADYKGNEKKILGVPFSQYIRGELDFRHYLSFSQTTKLVSRITGGMGYAYGNSITMPFVKEFFVGGPNDVRAFRSRSLGPGTYYAGSADTTNVTDQPGDIKMEMNVEFRFKAFSIVRWAFFVDVGNTWTLRYDSARVGSQFSKDFINQFAIGVGTGIRFDISILLLRFDYGVPVKEPWLAPGKQWVFDIKHGVLNFAIGYPF